MRKTTKSPGEKTTIRDRVLLCVALTALSAPVAPVGGFIGLASKFDLEIRRECGAVRLVSGQSLPVSAGRNVAAS